MDEPALLLHWEKALGELLDRTARFPKGARFTFIDTEGPRASTPWAWTSSRP